MAIGKGFKPNVIIRESQLIPICDEVIKLIADNKLKNEISNYIIAKKYPFSLFISAWYLVRLGHLSSPLLDLSESAKRLINILPISFKPFEDKALEIIKSTPFAESVNNIDYRFFEGRLIA